MGAWVLINDRWYYLRLIEHKIMAFDQAAPLQGWDLPAPFKTLQRLLEARQGKTGKREYVDVVARTQVVLVIGCSTSDLDT